MEFKDYYRTLGVARDAPVEEIRKSFRRLARKYHPDVSKEPDAEARMKEVNEAYAVLSDAEKRAAYDQLGADHRAGEEFRPPPGWDAGFEFSHHDFQGADYSDFFAELFGRMGARGQGGDHYAKVLLDIEDAFQGATRQISLRVPRAGPEGRVILETRTLEVRIPAGVREGQLIRLAGQGAAGAGKPGDLLLEVHFRAHPRYRVEGPDVHVDLPVAPWEAALGAVVKVQAPGGALNVRIPAGAQGGRVLRVRGKGMPGNPPGDLMLGLRVVLPSGDSERAKEIYESMARDLAFDPRAGT
ncbi:MAG TPA: DnaJ C-terminal domain-containing protein [Burkholderiales bacterium]|nr:DnaJ C-terminal domain-containing protein [Burkholderiales bacterium]